MIHHWKALHSKITDFEYQHDPSPSIEIIRGYFWIMRYGVGYPTSGASQKRRSSKS